MRYLALAVTVCLFTHQLRPDPPWRCAPPSQLGVKPSQYPLSHEAAGAQRRTWTLCCTASRRIDIAWQCVLAAGAGQDRRDTRRKITTKRLAAARASRAGAPGRQAFKPLCQRDTRPWHVSVSRSTPCECRREGLHVCNKRSTEGKDPFASPSATYTVPRRAPLAPVRRNSDKR